MKFGSVADLTLSGGFGLTKEECVCSLSTNRSAAKQISMSRARA